MLSFQLYNLSYAIFLIDVRGTVATAPVMSHLATVIRLLYNVHTPSTHTGHTNLDIRNRSNP